MDATDLDGYPLKSVASALIRGFRPSANKAFRNTKYQATFGLLLVPSNRCNGKIIIPHHGIGRAEEFPACADHNEFLQFRLESISIKALKKLTMIAW
jgi:hypothetical protein